MPEDNEPQERAIHICEDEDGNVKATISGQMKWLEVLFMLGVASDLVKGEMMKESALVIQPPFGRPGFARGN